MSVIFTGMGSGLVASVKVFGVPRPPLVDTNWQTAPTTPHTTINYGATAPATSLAINSDGTVFGTNTSGYVHDFKRVANTPSHVSQIDLQYMSPSDYRSQVAMSADGNVMHVGDPEGMRYFTYSRPNAATAWTRTVYNGITNNSAFGGAMSCSADGLAVAVGVPRQTVGSSTYLGTTWVLSTSPGIPNGYLNNPDISDTSIPAYGKLVALSGDGRICAIVGGGNNLGGATIRVFAVNLAGTAWALQSSFAWFSSPRFPTGIAINHDGSVLAVSGVAENNGSRFAGRVTVYKRTGSAWALDQNIAGQNTSAQLGDTVSLNDDGTVMLAASAFGVAVFTRADTTVDFTLRKYLGSGLNRNVAISRNGGWAISSNATNNLFVWKAGA